MISFYHNHLLKGPISKYLHIAGYDLKIGVLGDTIWSIRFLMATTEMLLYPSPTSLQTTVRIK